MKPETLIAVVGVLLVGILIIKNFLPEENKVINEVEENKVTYRNEIENQNITETVDTNTIIENVIDVSAIEELRKGTN